MATQRLLNLLMEIQQVLNALRKEVQNDGRKLFQLRPVLCDLSLHLSMEG